MCLLCGNGTREITPTHGASKGLFTFRDVRVYGDTCYASYLHSSQRIGTHRVSTSLGALIFLKNLNKNGMARVDSCRSRRKAVANHVIERLDVFSQFLLTVLNCLFFNVIVSGLIEEQFFFLFLIFELVIFARVVLLLFPFRKFVDVIAINGLARVIRWETPHRSIRVDKLTASAKFFFLPFSIMSTLNN